MTAQQNPPQALVCIIMGSRSDLDTMQHAQDMLTELGVAYETRIVSAHRTPDRLYQFAREAQGRGIQVIIAGAGGSAVPVSSKALNGVDSLLSIVQMPRGVAVATQAIGPPGAANAGLLAAQILSLGDAELRHRLAQWRQSLTDGVAEEVQ